MRRSSALDRRLLRQFTVGYRRAAHSRIWGSATSATTPSGRTRGSHLRRRYCGASPLRPRVAAAPSPRMASSAAAACGPAGLMQDAPWCRLTTSPMRLSRGTVGGVGLDLVWPLICSVWPVPRAPLVASFRACAMSRLALAMLLQRCRHTTFARRPPPAAVTRVGTDRA